MTNTQRNEITTRLQGISGEQEYSLESMMARHYASVYRLALSILDDPHEAEDITQETFITASMKMEDFRGEAGIKTWLFSIAINRARGSLRKRKAQNTLKNVLHSIQSLVASTDAPEMVTLQSENDKQLWQVVDSLGDKHRIPIILRYVHQMPIADIARILEVKEGTIHSRLFYAHEKIRRDLKRIGIFIVTDQEAS